MLSCGHNDSSGYGRNYDDLRRNYDDLNSNNRDGIRRALPSILSSSQFEESVKNSVSYSPSLCKYL